eukprot:5926908-Amphidinium_carterae.1
MIGKSHRSIPLSWTCACLNFRRKQRNMNDSHFGGVVWPRCWKLVDGVQLSVPGYLRFPFEIE